MVERSPIFSPKGDSPQIGYTAGNEAFDLFDRKCCDYSVMTGNLCDPLGDGAEHPELRRRAEGETANIKQNTTNKGFFRVRLFEK